MQSSCQDFANRYPASAYRQPVADYRLHYLDGSGGNIVLVREFEAQNDDAAIAYADDVRSLAAMELWQGEQKMKQWDAFPPT